MKLFAVGLISIVLLFSGCLGEKCPDCPNPSSYSECNDKAIKTRTSYRCSEATEFKCESFTEEKQCATEIKLNSIAGEMQGTVKPSIEEKVKGIIKIELNNAPEDTEIVAYYLEGGDLSPMGEGRRPEFATKQGDVWTGMLDTTQYENGLYKIGGVAGNEIGNDGPPKAAVFGQIIISN